MSYLSTDITDAHVNAAREPPPCQAPDADSGLVNTAQTAAFGAVAGDSGDGVPHGPWQCGNGPAAGRRITCTVRHRLAFPCGRLYVVSSLQA